MSAARSILAAALFAVVALTLPLGTATPALAAFTCDGTHPNSEFRWPIKSLSDPDRRSVNFHAVHTTIGRLRSFHRPATRVRPNTPRIAPEENTTYSVRARILRGKIEPDGDVILVVSPPARPQRTIVFEFGNPRCVTKQFKRQQIGEARRSIRRNCGPLGTNFTALHGRIRARGVGFWDRVHSEPYAAPNAFQLWPVLHVRGTCTHAP